MASVVRAEGPYLRTALRLGPSRVVQEVEQRPQVGGSLCQLQYWRRLLRSNVFQHVSVQTSQHTGRIDDDACAERRIPLNDIL